MANTMAQASAEIADEIPFTALDTPCCPNPPTCPEREEWRFKFKGCPPTFATQPSMQCEVAPLGDRYWVADLNPLLYERGLVSGAMWNPYQHMQARQGFIQFLTADMKKTTDPYSRPIKSLGDSFCVQQQRRGPPPYTQF